MNVVPDTSAVIDGRVSERVDSGAYEGATITVPEAVVGELEWQANEGHDTGWEGIEELQRLVELAEDEESTITVEYYGKRPDAGQKRDADEGEIDAIVRDVAAELGATLLTSDVVQAEVSRAKGLDVEYVEPRGRDAEGLEIESFFEVTTEAEMKEYAHDVMETARASPDGFVELDEPGMTIVQYQSYRIAVARPPFADGFEITAVRPIVKTDLDDYEFAEDLKERLLERQRGVLISGAPGAGKSTFAQAVAEFLASHDNAVKTMEKPRDLQVGPDITQYTALGGDMAKTADSLLLVRPDYTIYDEVRKTEDFEVFADMRLAGVGMVGVVHATRAIDALQRLVGRVELGMIPQVVDTVVFIEAGRVDTVYDVTTEVKVPEGLTAEDLARPVIQISDFETGKPAYEIYTFNRQVVTVPLDEGGEGSETGVSRLARKEVEREIRSIARGHVEVELKGQNEAVVYVEEDDISYVIGKGGGRISDVEDRLGISIDVRTLDEKPSGSSGGSGSGSGGGHNATGTAREGTVVTPEVTSRHVVVDADGGADVGETVEVRADDEYLFTATVGRGGEIQVSRGSAIADELERAIDEKRRITVLPT
jgi:ATPase